METKNCLIGIIILVVGLSAGYLLGKKCASYKANQTMYVTYSESQDTQLTSFVERVAAKCKSWPKISVTASDTHFVAHCAKK